MNWKLYLVLWNKNQIWICTMNYVETYIPDFFTIIFNGNNMNSYICSKHYLFIR